MVIKTDRINKDRISEEGIALILKDARLALPSRDFLHNHLDMIEDYIKALRTDTLKEAAEMNCLMCQGLSMWENEITLIPHDGYIHAPIDSMAAQVKCDSSLLWKAILNLENEA